MKIREVEINVVLEQKQEEHGLTVLNLPNQTSEKEFRIAVKSMLVDIFLNERVQIKTNIEYQASPASKIFTQEIFKYLKENDDYALRYLTVVVAEKDFKIYKKNIEGYLSYMLYKGLLGPYVTVDGIVEYEDGIVLIERSNPPLGYALPGGFVDYGESVETAVVREIKEETNLDFYDFKLLKVSSEPDRDPRFHTVSIVYYGKGKGQLCAGDDAANAYVFKISDLPKEMAFDHGQLLDEYLKKVKGL